jgi:hypothetical protein
MRKTQRMPRVWRALSAILLVAVAWGCPEVSAQSSVCAVQGKGLDPVAYENVTVSTVPIGLTLATLNAVQAAAAYVTLEGSAIRYTTFGTPSGTVGHLVDPPAGGNAQPGSGVWICGRAALTQLRAIRSGVSDGTLHVTLYRQR